MFKKIDKHQTALELISVCELFDSLDEKKEIKSMKKELFKDYESKTGIWEMNPYANPDTVYAQMKAGIIIQANSSEPIPQNELSELVENFLDAYNKKDKLIKEWIDPKQVN